MSNRLKASDKVAGNKYAEGKMQRWDLELREWRRRQQRLNGCWPSRQEEDDYFTTIHTHTDWVDDPEFGKPVEFTPEEIIEMRASAAGAGLGWQFENFLRKHRIDSQLKLEDVS